MTTNVQANLHEVQTEDFFKEFAECWNIVGSTFQRQAEAEGFCAPHPKCLFFWLKAELCPPFLEHFSFRLGNQIFLIRIETAGARIHSPGSREGLLRAAQGWHGHPCIFHVEKRGNRLFPALSGWGLVHAQTNEILNPAALITNDDIELTDWELHDFAIQVVRDDLRSKGRRIMSWASDPCVNPSLWFIGDSGPEWAVVRAVRYPQTSTEPPECIGELALEASRFAKRGHFGCVAFRHIKDPTQPLSRGYPVDVEYNGLVECTEASINMANFTQK